MACKPVQAVAMFGAAGAAPGSLLCPLKTCLHPVGCANWTLQGSAVMLQHSSRLLRQGPALLPAVSRQARLLTVAKAKQQKGDKGKKDAGGECWCHYFHRHSLLQCQSYFCGNP
jgi:hypothetical protein